MNKNKILQEFFFFNDKLLKIYKNYNNFYSIGKQFGGYSIEYNNMKIKFEKAVDDNLTTVYLSSLDKNNNCILILIYKDDKTAIIQGITSEKCFKNPEFNNGKYLLTITIKFLKKYKDKFNINRIELTDNSFINCNHEGIKIWLADLSLLQYGDTFYGRFGFIPNKKIDYNNLNDNKKLLEKLLTKNINLKEFVNINYELNKNLLKILYLSYDEFKNKLFIEWFNYISKKLMKKNCEFFEYFISNILKKLKLTSLAHKPFILEL